MSEATFPAEKNTCGGCRDGIKLPFEMQMAFQPIVDLPAGTVWGYEALVRGTRGESAAQILAMVSQETRYRFDQSARVLAIETAGKLCAGRDLRLSINFMPNAVYEPAACIQKSLAAAKRVGFPRHNLMFEFTEEERVTDADHIKRILTAYREFGFLTAIDDFGAGYAGLGLLAEMQPDVLKVDMNLIRGIQASPAKQAILSAIMGIGRALDIQVLAEGIEAEAELTVCRAAGVRLAQGYYFARPELMALPPVRGISADLLQAVG